MNETQMKEECDRFVQEFHEFMKEQYGPNPTGNQYVGTLIAMLAAVTIEVRLLRSELGGRRH